MSEEPTMSESQMQSDHQRVGKCEVAELLPVVLVDEKLDRYSNHRRCLADAGYDLLLARDGWDAVGHLDRHRVSLFIVDPHLQSWQGIELLRWVLVREPGAVVILHVEGKASDELEELWGAAGVLSQPADPAELCEILDAARSWETGDQGLVRWASSIRREEIRPSS